MFSVYFRQYKVAGNKPIPGYFPTRIYTILCAYPPVEIRLFPLHAYLHNIMCTSACGDSLIRVYFLCMRIYTIFCTCPHVGLRSSGCISTCGYAHKQVNLPLSGKTRFPVNFPIVRKYPFSQGNSTCGYTHKRVNLPLSGKTRFLVIFPIVRKYPFSQGNSLIPHVDIHIKE